MNPTRNLHKLVLRSFSAKEKEKIMPELVRCCRILSPFNPPFNNICLTSLPIRRSLQNQQANIQPHSTDHHQNGTVSWISHHSHPEISLFLQKGFSAITTRIAGKALHCLCVKGILPFGTFYSNTLLNMYSKFGDISRARYVFDEMPERTEASWSTMASGFVRVGMYSEVADLFRSMMGAGIDPNEFMMGSLITSFSRSENMISEGLQVHGFLVKSGFMYDVFMGTCLLNFYASYGFAREARDFFSEMPYRNVVTWTALMVGCLDAGKPEEVINMYRKMMKEGIPCNENTLTTLVGSCAMLQDDFLGYQVLGQVIKLGFEYNLSVANSLVSMFGNLTSLEEACYVFDNMKERDTISWNSMITAYAHNQHGGSALGCFNWMRHAHHGTNSATLSSLLSAFDSMEDLNQGRGIHGLTVKFGFYSNVYVCNTLLAMYSRVGRFDEAELLFQEIPEKDFISWSSMITCYAQHDKCLDAVQLLSSLLRTNIPVNHVAFASVLASCSSQEFLAEGKVVHALAIVSGFQDNVIVANSLVTLYAKCGLMREANQVFMMVPEHDVVTWNALIGGHAENEESNEALQTFKLMRYEGMPMNYITMVNILASFVCPSDLLMHGKPMHAHIICTGFELDEYVKNSLITMYAKCGDLDSSSIVFNGLTNVNYITFNAMVSANARHGRGEEALKLFAEMYSLQRELDQFSFSSAFAAAANLAALEEGKMLHCLVVKLRFESNVYVANAAMDMYGKCGEMNDVLKMLPSPINRSWLSWNILISAYSRHGCFVKVKQTFDEMIQWSIKPDHVTFVSLLSACSHRGLVDEGLAYYESMTKQFGVPAGKEHCVCMIDLLGRSGKLSEAEKFIKEMPIPPNGLVWRSLLASCRIHGNIELGKVAAQQLIELGPTDDSAYVLYSNVCATTGRWEDVENVRSLMENSNIKKQPACSWVKLKNRVFSFGMGDYSHPQSTQISEKLKELKRLIIEAGYSPDTSFALHDTDEEQKEHNLWNHSERIALAYALITTPEGSAVRIFKNLRVCGDCHSVFKFASAVVAREIILRDPYRFHHFSGGKCSCGDYW